MGGTQLGEVSAGQLRAVFTGVGLQRLRDGGAEHLEKLLLGLGDLLQHSGEIK